MDATMESLGLCEINPSNLTPIIRVDLTSGRCPACLGKMNPGQQSRLTMESVKAIEHGVETTGHVACPRCGMAIKTVRRGIEVAASNFRVSEMPP
jgi:hypothetical protein